MTFLLTEYEIYGGVAYCEACVLVCLNSYKTHLPYIFVLIIFHIRTLKWRGRRCDIAVGRCEELSLLRPTKRSCRCEGLPVSVTLCFCCFFVCVFVVAVVYYCVDITITQYFLYLYYFMLNKSCLSLSLRHIPHNFYFNWVTLIFTEKWFGHKCHDELETTKTKWSLSIFRLAKRRCSDQFSYIEIPQFLIECASIISASFICSETFKKNTHAVP